MTMVPASGPSAAYSVTCAAVDPPRAARLDVGGAVLSTSAALCTPSPAASPRSRRSLAPDA